MNLLTGLVVVDEKEELNEWLKNLVGSKIVNSLISWVFIYYIVIELIVFGYEVRRDSNFINF